MGTRITVMLKGPLGLGEADLLAGAVQDRCLVPAMTRRQFLRRRTPCGLP
jgi:hypothetical protein